MPHLMNCPHAEEGWCLDCVGKLYAEAKSYWPYVEAVAKNRMPFTMEDQAEAYRMYYERKRSLTTSGTQK
jgi:D-aminopeptidase